MFHVNQRDLTSGSQIDRLALIYHWVTALPFLALPRFTDETYRTLLLPKVWCYLLEGIWFVCVNHRTWPCSFQSPLHICWSTFCSLPPKQLYRPPILQPIFSIYYHAHFLIVRQIAWVAQLHRLFIPAAYYGNASLMSKSLIGRHLRLFQKQSYRQQILWSPSLHFLNFGHQTVFRHHE